MAAEVVVPRVKQQRIDTFCKLMKRKPSKHLKIPEAFYRDSMEEGVTVVAGGEEKEMKVVECEQTHYIEWGSFLTPNRIPKGGIVTVKHLHSNCVTVTVFSAAGVPWKLLPDWSKAAARPSSSSSSASSASSDADSDDSYTNEVPDAKTPVRGGGNQQWAEEIKHGNKPIHFSRDFRHSTVDGSEEAVAKARSFQERSLQNSSLMMVMSNRAIYQRTALPFIVRFVDRFCPWPDGEIILKDSDQKEWKVTWKSTRHPGIALGFENFVKAHDLRPGDVCVFEVLHGGFQVHIFKVDDSGRKQEHRNSLRYYQRRRKPDEEENASQQQQQQQQQPAKKMREKQQQEQQENEIVNGSDGSDGMRVEIVFKRDAAGMLFPHLTAVVPLTPQQFDKLRGPFASAEAMLETLLDKSNVNNTSDNMNNLNNNATSNSS